MISSYKKNKSLDYQFIPYVNGKVYKPTVRKLQLDSASLSFIICSFQIFQNPHQEDQEEEEEEEEAFEEEEQVMETL